MTLANKCLGAAMSPLENPQVEAVLATHYAKFQQAVTLYQQSVCMSELLGDLDRLPEIIRNTFDQLQLPESDLRFRDIRNRLESTSNSEECDKVLFIPLKRLLSKWNRNELGSIPEES